MTNVRVATVASDAPRNACEVSPLLRSITQGEVLSLLGIGVFAELLTVGWIAMALGVNEGRASWGQALGMAAVDFVSLLWLPIPVFALFDAFPINGPHARRQWVIRIVGAICIGIVSAIVVGWCARAGGRLFGIEALSINGLAPGFAEQLFWAGCSVCGLSLTYLVLRRLHRARDLEHRNGELQRLAVEAQLMALSAELRPHFLFNAINNLAELVHHDPARTEAMLLHLSSLLQGTLTAGQRRTVSLADELAHIDDYLALQQMRFAERLTVVRDIAPDVMHAAVPPMLLQPLVENAIVHGIEGRTGASMISLTTRATGGTLEIEVQDDGPGPYRSGHVGTGTGLRNVRARLVALYGDAAHVTLCERPGGGARLIVQLPMERV